MIKTKGEENDRKRQSENKIQGTFNDQNSR